MPLRGRRRYTAPQHKDHLRDIYSIVIRDQTGQYYRLTFKIDLRRLTKVYSRVWHSKEQQTTVDDGLFIVRGKRVYPRPGAREGSQEVGDYADAPADRSGHTGDDGTSPGAAETA